MVLSWDASKNQLVIDVPPGMEVSVDVWCHETMLAKCVQLLDVTAAVPLPLRTNTFCPEYGNAEAYHGYVLVRDDSSGFRLGLNTWIAKDCSSGTWQQCFVQRQVMTDPDHVEVIMSVGQPDTIKIQVSTVKFDKSGSLGSAPQPAGIVIVVDKTEEPVLNA